MSENLKRAIKSVVKPLANRDLTGTNFAIQDGQIFYQGSPLVDNPTPAACIELAKLMNPDHETENLLAAEIEVALAIFSKRQGEAQRRMLREQLDRKGSEVNLGPS